MDTIIRASSFENVSKKILILFDTEDSFKNKLVNEGYVLFSIFERNGYENLKEEEAKENTDIKEDTEATNS